MIGMRGDQAMPMLESGARRARLARRLPRRVVGAHARARARRDPESGPASSSCSSGSPRGVCPARSRRPPQRASARELLERTDIARFFRTVTGGDDVVEPKPAPEIYLKAAASLGVEARDCCAFEDSGPGTRAAVASGATVVQVPDLVAPTEEIRALGHLIAHDVLDGARQVGLID